MSDKNLIVIQHTSHEKTWVVPHNPNHKIHALTVFNKSGIKLKTKFKIFGDKILIHLPGAAVGEVRLAVSNKHFLLKTFMNYCYNAVTGLFKKIFSKKKKTYQLKN